MKMSLQKTLVLTLCVVILLFFAYLESLSPAYLFINDTDHAVDGMFLSGTSPAVRMHLAPGQSKFVDMEFWWREPEFYKASPEPLNVEPTYNFLLFKIVRISRLQKAQN